MRVREVVPLGCGHGFRDRCTVRCPAHRVRGARQCTCSSMTRSCRLNVVGQDGRSGSLTLSWSAGRSAGDAGSPLAGTLAAFLLLPPGWDVPLPAKQPATASGSTLPGRCWTKPCTRWPRRSRSTLTRSGSSTRRGALRHLPAHPTTLRPGWLGQLRLLRQPLPLVLGSEAVPGHHRPRHAGDVVSGRSETRRTRGRPRTTRPRPRPPPAAPVVVLIGDKGFSGHGFEARPPS